MTFGTNHASSDESLVQEFPPRPIHNEQQLQVAAGLIDDYAVLKASMMTEISNSPVEGLNNKLKMLKRQMYGRAGLKLLTKRFIMAA